MWGEIANAIASTVNTGLNLWGAEKAQDTDVQMFHEANQFNKEEAQRARDWAGEQRVAQENFNWGSMKAAMGFNAAETEKARRFNQMMSETEYQRAVGDMKAAGLNPMLAYMKGGSSVQGTSAASVAGASVGLPGGASASSVSPPRARNILGEAGSSALKSMEVMSVLARQEAETDFIRANEAKVRAEIPKVVQETETSRSSAKHMDAQVEQIKAVIPQVLEVTKKVVQETKNEEVRNFLIQAQDMLHRAQTNESWSRIQLNDVMAKVQHIESILKGNDVARSEAMREKFEGEWGRRVTPYLPDIDSLGGGIMDALRLGKKPGSINIYKGK